MKKLLLLTTLATLLISCQKESFDYINESAIDQKIELSEDDEIITTTFSSNESSKFFYTSDNKTIKESGTKLVVVDTVKVGSRIIGSIYGSVENNNLNISINNKLNCLTTDSIAGVVYFVEKSFDSLK